MPGTPSLKPYGGETLSSHARKRETQPGDQVFLHTWVEKKTKGVTKSRLTVADSRKRQSKEELLDELSSTSVPTPHEETHTAVEIYALKKGLNTRPFDVVCAFSIGLDPGDEEGKPACVKSCAEWVLLCSVETHILRKLNYSNEKSCVGLS